LCPVEILENRDDKCESLSATSFGGSKDIYAFQREGYGFGLNVCEFDEMGGFEAGFCKIGER